MEKFVVDYGTIHGMKVEIECPYNGYDLLTAWAKAYVDYVQKNSICSDESLVRSIGSDCAKEALILGIERNYEKEISKVFLRIAKTQGLWECALLKERYGKKKGYEIYMKNFSGYSSEEAEEMIKIHNQL